jgi:hypothetical protein
MATTAIPLLAQAPITILNNLEIEPGSTFLLSNSPGADLNLYGNFVDKTIVSTGFNPNDRVVKFLGTTQTVFKVTGIVGFSDVLINQSPRRQSPIIESDRYQRPVESQHCRRLARVERPGA